MMVTIPIYQQKLEGGLTWTTIGLGPLTQRAQGRSALKVQRALSEQLKRASKDVEAEALRQLRLPRGLTLERLRLDLSLDDPTLGKRKTTGRYPLVLEPRWINAETRIHCVYHPARQHQWFALPCDSGAAILEQRARLYFRDAWSDLHEEFLAELRSDGKDSLRSLSLELPLPSLLDRLPNKPKGPFADLDPDLFKGKKKRPRELQVLRRLGVDLTLRGADHCLDVGMPRQPYRQQLMLALGGTSRQSTIVCGPPQSGKSTLVHRFVTDLLEAEGFATHRNLDRLTHVWSISGQRVIAGMSYLGDWEQRCIELLQDASRRRVILVVEDLHAFGRLGRSRDSDRNLAEFFRAPLSRGELTIVGECTPEQLSRLEDDAPSFAALFTRIPVQGASDGETLRMLIHEARRQEQEAAIAVDPLLHQQILELTASLFPQAAFPGKALDLLREVCRRQGDNDDEGRTPIGSEELLGAIAARTGLPLALLAPKSPLRRADLQRSLEAHVMGQDRAVEAAADLLLRIRAGLTDPRRPYAVYLFSGPTGTGKTELCKCIAEYLYGDERRLLRFDMGEYATADAAARLCGDRFAPRGLLTEQVRQQPFCVVLLDEIEKAHPAVLNLLLQLFDEGRLTDAAGNRADFTHAVVIMTSNLGARDRAPAGFSEADSANTILAEVNHAVRSFFPPELFNRIDRVIPFAPLDQRAAQRIAEKELRQLLARRGLVERNVFVDPTAAVLERIVDRGFDPLYGARTVKRFLEREVGSLLAEHIAGSEAAAMRQLALYAPSEARGGADGGLFALHGEQLVEAEATAEELPLEPLLKASVSELRKLLPQTLDDLDALLDDRAFTDLGERMAAHLGQLQERFLGLPAAETSSAERDHADALFNLDTLRGQLRALRGRIGYMQVKKRGDRDALLENLAEVRFLKRALGHIDDLGEHTVVVELSHVGIVRRSQRFLERGSGLLVELAEAYCSGARRGEIEGWAARKSHGALISGEGPPTLLPADAVERLVLCVVGLGVKDFFLGERGCHIWRSLSHGSDVLRVDVWSPGDDQARPPRSRAVALLEQREAANERFRDALEAGQDPLPENPGRLLPLVRSYRFDPPRDPTRSGEIELEDYALGYAASQHVRRIADALPQLWLLRQSRVEDDQGQEVRS